MAVSYSFQRYEIKYFLNEEKQAALLKKMEPYMIPDVYGKYGICSIYYDTKDWRLIRASIEKPAYKEKLRIRSYGPAEDNSSVFIELKKKVDAFLKSHNASVQIRQGYGLTECVTASCLTPKDYNRVGSIGVPFPDTYYKIVKPGTTDEIDPNVEGEICISGPSVMLRYVDNPEETEHTLRRHDDGRVWLHTGDLGKMDEDGFVYLDSRIKRLIIRHDGFKVFPSMIENVISQHPAVHQCSVVGCTDKDHVQGRLPFVYIVLDPEAAVSVKKRQIIKELRQLCAEELPEYVQPVGYKFIDSMPMTPVGKFDYRKLEEEITSRDY